jgi:hypothetical protein
MDDNDPARTTSAIRPAATDSWSHPAEHAFARVQWAQAFVTWGIGAAASIVIALVAAAVYAAISGAGQLDGDLMIAITALSAFFGFLGALVWRLPRVVEHDRLLNSLAVAGINIGIGLAVLLVDAVVGATTGSDLTDLLAGHTISEAGIGFFAIERSAVTVIAAAFLAAGIVPEQGPTEPGAQLRPQDDDRSL